MAKKQVKMRSESVSYSYPRTYSIVLWNTGEKDHGSTWATLYDLIHEEIVRIDQGKSRAGRLKALLVIRDQMDEEFEKGRD